jgi:hypothetical protein
MNSLCRRCARHYCSDDIVDKYCHLKEQQAWFGKDVKEP